MRAATSKCPLQISIYLRFLTLMERALHSVSLFESFRYYCTNCQSIHVVLLRIEGFGCEIGNSLLYVTFAHLAMTSYCQVLSISLTGSFSTRLVDLIDQFPPCHALSPTPKPKSKRPASRIWSKPPVAKQYNILARRSATIGVSKPCYQQGCRRRNTIVDIHPEPAGNDYHICWVEIEEWSLSPKLIIELA